MNHTFLHLMLKGIYGIHGKNFFSNTTEASIMVADVGFMEGGNGNLPLI